jgi:acyl dehydratase
MTYVSDEMRARIGLKSERRTATEPIGYDSLRRFVQATMEQNPIHLDEATARASRFGGFVLPPLYPVHAFRLPLGSPDTLDRAKDDRDFDGSRAGPGPLAPLGLALKRHLNAGSEIEFFQLPEVGDVISETSAYRAIEEKESSKGPMVIETIETEYTNQRGETLLKVYKSSISR